MNFNEAVEFLDARIRYGMRPGTERVRALVDALNHPEREYPCIHVAGTNGKFSVAVMTTALLGELGLTVGTYTSPHLETVRERIAVGGVPIAPDDFAGLVEYLAPYLDMLEAGRDDPVTYFELLTVMALEWFFDRPVHVAVLECGLGGEYDATNVADARVAVVTRVERDHIAEFGDDPLKAAWEKAGIIKPGSWAITGELAPAVLKVVDDRAREATAHHVDVLGRDFLVDERLPAVGGQVIAVRGIFGRYDEVLVPLFGSHQADNAALAVAAVERFTQSALDADAVRNAFAQVRLPGRIEVACRNPLVVIDGGHNPDAAVALVGALVESFAYDRIVCVIGMLSDKLVGDVTAIMSRACEEFVVTVPPGSPRAAPVLEIADGLRDAGVEAGRITEVPEVPAAMEAAVGRAGPDDLVLVFGSLYLAGEARAWLRRAGLLTHP